MSIGTQLKWCECPCGQPIVVPIFHNKEADKHIFCEECYEIIKTHQNKEEFND